MRILIVEDNKPLAQAIGYRLRDRGHSVDLIIDGKEADTFLSRVSADLVILDLNLPGMSGLDVLKNMRQRSNSAPVLLLTARGSTKDRVTGLDLGADDYLVKPFEMDELEARIRALLRRRNLAYEVFDELGVLRVDRLGRVATVNGEVLNLPRREFAVLECLLEHKQRIVSKNALLNHVYGIDSDVEITAIEPHISRLRQKLAGHGISIGVARGLGYFIEEKS